MSEEQPKAVGFQPGHPRYGGKKKRTAAEPFPWTTISAGTTKFAEVNIRYPSRALVVRGGI